MNEYTKDRAEELAEDYYFKNDHNKVGRVSNRKKKAKALEEEEKEKSERIAKEKAASKSNKAAEKARLSWEEAAAEAEEEAMLSWEESAAEARLAREESAEKARLTREEAAAEARLAREEERATKSKESKIRREKKAEEEAAKAAAERFSAGEYTQDYADELAEDYCFKNDHNKRSRVSNRKNESKKLEEKEKRVAERKVREKVQAKKRAAKEAEAAKVREIEEEEEAKERAAEEAEAAKVREIEEAEAAKAREAAEEEAMLSWEEAEEEAMLSWEAAAAEAEREANKALKEAARSAVNEAYEAVEIARDNYWAIPIDVEKIEETRVALSESREAFVNAIKKLMPELRALEALAHKIYDELKDVQTREITGEPEADFISAIVELVRVDYDIQNIIGNVEGFLRDLGVKALLGIDDEGLEELEAVLKEVMEDDIAEAEAAAERFSAGEYTRDDADELADEYYQVNYNDSLGIRVSKRNKKAKELEEEEKAKSERIAKEKAATKERGKAAKAKVSGDIEAAEKAEAEKAAAVAAKKEARAAVAAEEAAARSAVNEAYEAVETARDNYWAIPIDVEKIEETRTSLSESREAFVDAIKKLMPELSALEVLQNEEQYVQDIINNVEGFLRDLGVGAFLRGIDDAGLEELKEILEELIEADIAEAEKAAAAKAIARALVLGQDLVEYVPLTPDTVDHNTEDNGANLEQEESEAIALWFSLDEGLVEGNVPNGQAYTPLTPDNTTHDVEDDVTVVRTPLETSGGWKYTDLLDEC